MLTGQPLFHGVSPTEKLIKHQIDPPPPITRLRPDVPASLTALLERLLAKRPEQRYQTPAETAAALAAILGGDAVPRMQTASPIPRATPARTAASGQAMKDTYASWSSIMDAPAAEDSLSSIQRRQVALRRRKMFWSVTVGIALLAVVALILLLR